MNQPPLRVSIPIDSHIYKKINNISFFNESQHFYCILEGFDEEAQHNLKPPFSVHRLI
jgi:hypothetical protein